MGRSIDEAPELFIAASAAGAGGFDALLLANGTEAEKGTEVVQAAHAQLSGVYTNTALVSGEDSDGNLYTADVHVGRPQKFSPKKGANPAHLIGRYFPRATTN